MANYQELNQEKGLSIKAPAAQVEFVKEEASDTEVTDEITEETA